MSSITDLIQHRTADQTQEHSSRVAVSVDYSESRGLFGSHCSLSAACTLIATKNNIRKIEGLDSLVNLEYLALNNNQISTVENLTHLKLLQGLNLSSNCIEDF
jgi:Leucine-rich repeat (LRR) protein